MNKETYSNHTLICPYCGHKVLDTWELFAELEETIDEFVCPNCDTTYTAVSEINRIYKGIPNKNQGENKND